MAGGERLVVCASGALAEGGDGVRFEVKRGRETAPAFAVRYEGRVYAYVNRCAHVGVELDWQAGRFFDADGMVLLCSTHGALYDPASGACVRPVLPAWTTYRCWSVTWPTRQPP